MTFDIKRTRDYLQGLEFKQLFNELGWSSPKNARPVRMEVHDEVFERVEIAELAGVAVFEVVAQTSEGNPEGKIPGARTRKAIYAEIVGQYHENLLIFLNAERSQSLWYWVKRDGTKTEPRENLYVKGQPGDLSLGKLEAMVVELSEFDESGNVRVTDIVRKLSEALDVERVTKQFYDEFKQVHLDFLNLITGIDDERDQQWYASVLLNRLMFIYFLQRKRFVDNGDIWYLQQKLAQSKGRGPDRYYSEFLHLLFFEGFAKPAEERNEAAKKLLGTIKYLNGGLFLPHPIEKRWPNIQIPDVAFTNLFKLFESYSWNLDDTPGGQDNEISPHVLGYIFEKYINQKFFGAYYTRPEITEYLCDRTIHKLILEKINTPAIIGATKGRRFETVDELLMGLDAPLCRELLHILPTISLLDPACGSGAFLVSAMNTLINIYSAITGKIEFLNNAYLTGWLQQAHAEHDSLNYYIKKKIITENLFGVDIMEEATEIAKLRLFLALVSSVQNVEQLEPLPNIDFNILPGNSLIGLLRVNEEAFDKRLSQLNLFQKPFHELVAEKNRQVATYKSASKYSEDLRDLRDNIQTLRSDATNTLNELLLDDFKSAGAKYEQATWDSAKQTDGKPLKRDLRIEDIAHLHPFHWGYEFDRVMNERGGFDIIITNPPWEILKPQAKEFFNLHSGLVSKNKMRIEDFEEEKARLLQDPEIRAAWLDYQSSFPYQSGYFRAAPQYVNQISTVNGKKQGTDINLYKLFTEQCYNLLHEGGQCGIVIPSGIYTDLGAKQLRELLFTRTSMSGLFCFENNKPIFEGVHRSFKFIVLTYEKGGQTESFPAAFMRHDVAELDRFPRTGALNMSVELIRRLSPDSLSVMEFKNAMDVAIAQKMLRFPLLGEKLPDTWNLSLTREFDMTNDSHLFKTSDGPGRLPLYEGKMIHQFTHTWAEPRYWVDADQGRNELLRQELRRAEMSLDLLASSQNSFNYLSNRQERVSALLKIHGYSALTVTDLCIATDAPRLAFRDIARNTDERTLISAIIPPEIFVGNTLNCTIYWFFNTENMLLHPQNIKGCYEPTLAATTLAYLCGVLNSFTLDYIVRFKVSAHVNMFYFYQLPVARLKTIDPRCQAIAERVARLVCVGPEFDDLRRELLGDVHAHVGTDNAERKRLQAEIDGLVAHLYGLTEEEFIHVLETFPLVKQPVKDAALEAYREFALEPDDLIIAGLIAKGENERVEFKVAACWNPFTKSRDDKMKMKIVEEVAAFMNKDGGKLLIGVTDGGNVVGLAEDYMVANPKKQNRDGYQLFLRSILNDYLGAEFAHLYTISFHTLRGKDVCCIDVQPATEPVFVPENKFYVRNGNGKLQMNMKEAMTYQRQHWGK